MLGNLYGNAIVLAKDQATQNDVGIEMSEPTKMDASKRKCLRNLLMLLLVVGKRHSNFRMSQCIKNSQYP